MGKIMKNGVELSGSSNSAENIKYDDTKNVKEAIGDLTNGLTSTNTKVNSTGVRRINCTENYAYDTTTAAWGCEPYHITDKNGIRIAYMNNRFNGDGTTDLHIGSDRGIVCVDGTLNAGLIKSDNLGQIFKTTTLLTTSGSSAGTYNLMALTLPMGRYASTFSKRIDEFSCTGRLFPFIGDSNHIYSGGKPSASMTGFSITYFFELFVDTTVYAGIYAEAEWSTNLNFGLFQAIRLR